MKLLAKAVLVAIPTFEVGGPDGNIKVDFSILFKRQKSSESRKRQKALRGSLGAMTNIQTLLAAEERDIAAIAEVEDELEGIEKKADKILFDNIVGWRGLKEDDGTDIPYSVEDKKAILDHEGFRTAILEVWSLSTGGVKPEAIAEAKRKN